MTTRRTDHTPPDRTGLAPADPNQLRRRAVRRLPWPVRVGWLLCGAGVGVATDFVTGFLTGDRDAAALLGALAAGVALRLTAPFLFRSARPYVRRELGIDCPTCGYNLTGNVSGVCPECGTPITPPPPR